MSTSPGGEAYWQAVDDSTPEEGTLALLAGRSSDALLYVVEPRHDAREAVCLLVAELHEERQRMILEGTDTQQRGLVEPLRKAYQCEELTVPYENLRLLQEGDA